MYHNIYRVQSSTQRLPIWALFGFTLKLVEFYSPPFPLRVSCVMVCPWVILGSPHHYPSFLHSCYSGPCSTAGPSLTLSRHLSCRSQWGDGLWGVYGTTWRICWGRSQSQGVSAPESYLWQQTGQKPLEQEDVLCAWVSWFQADLLWCQHLHLLGWCHHHSPCICQWYDPSVEVWSCHQVFYHATEPALQDLWFGAYHSASGDQNWQGLFQVLHLALPEAVLPWHLGQVWNGKL